MPPRETSMAARRQIGCGPRPTPQLSHTPSAPLALGPSASGWPPSRAPEPSPLVTSDLAGGGGSGAAGLGDDLWGQTVSH